MLSQLVTMNQRSDENSKKNILKSFSNYKTLSLRKILEAFKTLSISVMKIEANILLTRVRLNKKIRDYRVKIMTLEEQHSVKLRILSTFQNQN